MDTLFLKKDEDRRLRAGHLWVFSNEVDVARSPLTAFAPGQSAHIADCRGKILGTAYVNPASLIAARLLSFRPETPLDADMLRSRLSKALALREKLFDQPFYRLCHAEGDYLPGLVADRYGDCLTVQISTAGMEAHAAEAVDILVQLTGAKTVFLANDIPGRELEGLNRDNRAVLGQTPESVEVRENGCLFTAPLAEGQKTGWFYDQRDNRAAIMPFCRKARVLDAFCYAGGFGATAAKAGASAVTFLDASAMALDWAKANAERNASAQAAVSCLRGDAFELLAELARAGEKFDVVSLDPPAFMKRRKDKKQGLEAYRRVNELGLSLVAEGGILITASCSHHLEAGELHRLATRAAPRKGLSLRLLRQGFQGPDHPIHPAMPETAYLKSFLYEA